jgi:hypothetical protein
MLVAFSAEEHSPRKYFNASQAARCAKRRAGAGHVPDERLEPTRRAVLCSVSHRASARPGQQGALMRRCGAVLCTLWLQVACPLVLCRRCGACSCSAAMQRLRTSLVCDPKKLDSWWLEVCVSRLRSLPQIVTKAAACDNLSDLCDVTCTSRHKCALMGCISMP